MTKHEVSLVDFGDGTSQDSLGQAVYRALQETGFVRLRRPRQYNYGLIHEVHAAACKFFDLPEAELRRLYVPELKGERGYMPRRMETAVAAKRPDEKRYFSIGRDGGSVHANLFPTDDLLPGFRSLLLEGFDMFDRVVRDLAESLGPIVGVPSLAEGLTGGDSLWRLINYDELDGTESKDAVRSTAHRDVSLLTLLPTATGSGLQIYTDGRWLDVGGDADELIVNAGDALTLLAKAAGHNLPSTEHRVVNGDGKRRISAPFFGHVNRAFVLDPVTGLTEGEFLDRRLAEIIRK